MPVDFALPYLMTSSAEVTMQATAFETVDVFTTQRFGGNPLAVIADARGLSGEQMQRIASEFNYSETAFVLPPQEPEHSALVRIFTPTNEIAFAGHPNVGTAFVLGRQESVFGKPIDRSMRFEQGAGLVSVDLLHQQQSVVGARIKAPRRLEIISAIDTEIVASCVSLHTGEIVTDSHAPTMVSVGLPFVAVETSLDGLGRARPNWAAFAAADRACPHAADRFSIFLYSRTGHGIERLQARMFAPLNNIWEDPATGSASAALGGYLAWLDPRDDVDLEIAVKQGLKMGRPSAIGVDVRKRAGCVLEVAIAGFCVPVMQGMIKM
jgi:trans-2,3-dihydro-3-hydroxyanthranilate isomerase